MTVLDVLEWWKKQKRKKAKEKTADYNLVYELAKKKNNLCVWNHVNTYNTIIPCRSFNQSTFFMKTSTRFIKSYIPWLWTTNLKSKPCVLWRLVKKISIKFQKVGVEIASISEWKALWGFPRPNGELRGAPITPCGLRNDTGD